MVYVYQVYSPLLDMVIGTFDDGKKAELCAADENLKLLVAYRNYHTNQYIGKLIEIAKEPRPLVTPKRRLELGSFHVHCNPEHFAQRLADVSDDNVAFNQVISDIKNLFWDIFGLHNHFQVKFVGVNDKTDW